MKAKAKKRPATKKAVKKSVAKKPATIARKVRRKAAQSAPPRRKRHPLITSPRGPFRHPYLTTPDTKFDKDGKFRVAQVLAGHKTINTTQVYAHLAPKNRRDAIAVLNRANQEASKAA